MDIDEQSRTTQVLIAGAGPVGLMMAIELRLGGVDVLVVEQRPTGTVGESRAVGVNSRSLETLAQRGLAERCMQAGSPMSMVLFGGVFMNPGAFDAEWPSALRLPQHLTERILAEHAAELGADFEWSTRVVDLAQDENGVVVNLESPGGQTQVRADYLVGCDGGRSVVRQSAGIEFPGVVGDDWWVVGDIDLADPPSDDGSFGRNDRVGFYQVSRAESDYFRLTLMCRTPPADFTKPVTLEEVRAAMIDGLGTDYGLRGARWISRWSDGFRQAAEYRRGRVFLAGDAAHTHPPIGGQGLNVGLQDAANLGWKLAAVLRGEVSESLLDTYHEERAAVERDATRWSLAQTELVKPGERRQAMREVFQDLITIPDTCLRLSGQLSGLTLRYKMTNQDHPLVGRRMPNVSLIVDGVATDVFTLLESARPLLIEFGDGRFTSSLESRGDRVRQVIATYEADVRGDEWHFPVFSEVPVFTAALVRPDGYVAWIGGGGSEAAAKKSLSAALNQWVGGQS